MEKIDLAELFGADPSGDGASVAEAIEAWAAARGIPEPEAGADPDDPRVSLHFLLRMAARSARGAPRPVDPALEASFEEAVRARPGRRGEHGQLHIDAASSIRRAEAIVARCPPGGGVLAVGDDDAVTVALGLLDPGRALGEHAAVDIDEELLAWLASRRVETQPVDVFHEAVPEDLRRRFALVVTDPFRDLDGGLGFLSFAAACVRREPESRLLWVDDPDWNYEHAVVRAALEGLGWRVREALEELHRYPLDEGSFAVDEIAGALGLEAAWLRAVRRHADARSNLYVLSR